MSDTVTLLPPNATTVERALAHSLARLSALDPGCRQMWDPALCPPAHLPWLAWALSVDRWDSDWTDAQKRAACATSYRVHRHKGTVGAMRTALGALGYSIQVTEWHQESPPAPAYTFGLTADLPGAIDAALWDDIEAVATATKNVRSHMRYIRLRTTAHGRMYVGGTTLTAERARVDPYSLSLLRADGRIVAGGALVSHDICTVYPPAEIVPVLLLTTGAPLHLSDGRPLRLVN